MLQFLQGKKTYIVMVAGIIVHGCYAMGYIDEKTLIAIDGVLGMLGLGTIRAGIAKGPRIGLFLALLFLTAGCAIPKIDSKDVQPIIDALGKDTASACFWLGGRGGAGGGSITPLPVVPMAGYASGEVLVGRVNAPDTKLSIINGSCTIERGQ